MPTDVIMPQMGESIFEGTLTKWLKKPGDKVSRDEPLFEISTDKVDTEIPSPVAGVLREQKVSEGTTVQVNTVVGVIDAEGAAPSASAPQAKPAPQAEAKPEAKPAQAGKADQKPAAGKNIPSDGEEVEIDTRRRERPDVETAARGGEERAVAQQQQTLVQPGFRSAPSGGGAQAPQAPARPAGGDGAGRELRSSPLVRRIAKDKQVDLHQVPGTGMGGRITKDDILNF